MGAPTNMLFGHSEKGTTNGEQFEGPMPFEREFIFFFDLCYCGQYLLGLIMYKFLFDV